MIEQNQKMGIAGIPGTFPTGTILFELKKELPIFDWTYKKVDNIYLYYKDALNSGDFEPYGPGGTDLVEWISEKSGYGVGEVRGELAIIRSMAQTGDIDSYYWTQNKPASSITKKIESAITSTGVTFQQFGTAIKWVGIILISGGVLYVTWPMIKKIRG